MKALIKVLDPSVHSSVAVWNWIAVVITEKVVGCPQYVFVGMFGMVSPKFMVSKNYDWFIIMFSGLCHIFLNFYLLIIFIVSFKSRSNVKV